MKKSTFVLIAMVLFVLSSCKNDAPKKEEATEKAKAEACTYTITPDNPVSVSWTAYKTTAKVGVGGKFTKFSFTDGKPSTSIAEVIKGRAFKVLTDSTNTGNPTRDAKIVAFFWNKMVNTQEITGMVKEVIGDNKQGKAVFNIKLNDLPTDADFIYTVGDNEITFEGEINLENWNAMAAVESLNEACKDLHTGKDGVSKTWPNVSIVIKVGFKKECE